MSERLNCKGIKVLSRNEYYELGSVWLQKEVSFGHTKYKEGELTRRKGGCGPLAVFSTIRAAWAFVDSYGCYKDYPMFPYYCTYSRSRAKTLWFPRKDGSIRRLRPYGMPPGTRLADVLLLGKQIKEA